MASLEFRLAPDHLKLLRAANIAWNDNAPGMDSKRPLGNGDLLRDVAKTLGWDWQDDADWYSPEWDALRRRAMSIFRDMKLALSLLCFFAGMELTPGLYRQDGIRGWERVGD